MPIRHEFSRTAAALGTALALVFLPITATIVPANALPTPSVEADASAAGNAGSEAGASADGTDAASAADSGGSDSASSDSSSDGVTATDSGAAGNDDAVEADADSGAEGGDTDPACDPSTDDDSATGDDENKPCPVEEPLDSTWDPSAKTITISVSNDIPDSWVGVTFDGPGPGNRGLIPPQSSSDSEPTPESSAAGAQPEGDTDDSGNPVPSTAAEDVPTKFMLNTKGEVVDADHPGTVMVFKHFDEDPGWTFTSDGDNIIVEGEEYTDNSDDGATAGAASDGTADSNGVGPDGGGKDSSNDAGTSASKDSGAGADGTDSDTGSNSNSGSSGNKSDSADASGSNTSSNSDSESSSDTSSDADSADSAQADAKESDASSASNADSATQNSDSNSSSASDGTDSGSSDSEGSSDKDGGQDGKDDKGSEDTDGSGTTSGDEGPDGEDTTPDPATGNGSSDTRDQIPGDVGNDWMPGNGDSPPPDYSDPVPQNPDTPVPDDDTDLITGGDTPEPRSDKPSSPSFGESIVSTIASSWPVFILAASGMAAVGFIIWLVGRRNKQN